ncbi:anti-sigma-factor antagonist [endosymbiont of Acanthamoeba sp. UWC8]|nr:STAS domain-containing protein [Candidatus Jidaibacter acanthamoeba]AIF81087.1 anti-sigma-factor antagonist [endosymbiont of Acanthamoeba sp. UWC8]MBA8667062.1 STAS domain-containing protein [Holosporaceae bacterium 'Namur']
MEYTYKEEEQGIKLKLTGKFTFTDNKAFLSFIEDTIAKNFNTLFIDLAGVDFIDSAALGILLLTRDKCANTNIKLILCSPEGQVKQMFKISKFDRLFDIR